MPVNMERLRDRGIDSIQLELSTTDVCPAIESILRRNSYGSDDAQVFSLSSVGRNSHSEKVTVLGRLDAVLHKNTEGLNLSSSVKKCKCVVFIYTLYTEPEFSACGIASDMLEQLHVQVEKEFGLFVEAELLAPAPQYKNDAGDIIQVPIGVEYFMRLQELVSFYSKRGFSLDTDSFLIMCKQIRK